MADERDLIARIHALTTPMQPQPTGAEAELAPLAGIRAVLFDVYGTLVISGCGDIGLTSADDEQDQFRAALAAAGVPSGALAPGDDGTARLHAAIAASHARSRERGIDYPEVDILAVWSDVLRTLGAAVSADTLRQVAIEYEFRSNAVWPMPGLAEVIARLSGRGMVLGVVSNAQFYTPLMLRAFLARDMAEAGFDSRCCAWSFRQGVAKPSPNVYEPALAGLARHHGIAPSEVLYVGNDRRNDIWPAGQLGCRTALFAGDARSLRLRPEDPELEGVAPDRVVTDLRQISDRLLESSKH